MEAARDELGEVTSDRGRVFLLHGPPLRRLEADCVAVLEPLEIWEYGEEATGDRDLPALVLFTAPTSKGDGWTVWIPWQGPDVLMSVPVGLLRDWFDNISAGEQATWIERVRLWLESGRRGTGSLARRRASLEVVPLAPCEADPGLCQRSPFFFLFLEMFRRCPSQPVLANLILEAVGREDLDPTPLAGLTSLRRQPDEGEGFLARFVDRLTNVVSDAPRLPASLEIAYTGRRGSRTLAECRLRVPVAGVTASKETPAAFRFKVNGEVLGGSELFESFQYVFELAADGDDDLLLVFQRPLRPGPFRLVLRLEDLTGGAMTRLESELEVPKPEARVAASAPGVERALAAAADELERGSATLTLQAPGSYAAGYTRVAATASGPVAKVEFLLDGKLVLAKTRPPYGLELDLGPIPRPRLLEAIAYDDSDTPVARDTVELNRGEHRFSVRLIEPRDGGTYRGTVITRAEVKTPREAELERVELWLDERRVATLYQEPFVQPITVEGRGVTLVRCVAVLTDGNSIEDTAILNAPGTSERLEVRLLELYATVTRAGRTVYDLSLEDVTLLESGAPQQILRFEHVRDLPLHLGVLLDTSGSMKERLIAARSAAITFFAESVEPRDRVLVVTFHERPQVRVPFTNDLEAMQSGLRALAAGQGTAFFDSLVFALYQFAGITGPRALLVISDGRDRESRFSFDETLEYARRSGVVVYTIGLEGAKGALARSKLNRLAAETGGRAIFLENVEELLPVYREIEQELRSRYLLAYQSAAAPGDVQFRPIELRTSDPELEVSTLAGYYP